MEQPDVVNSPPPRPARPQGMLAIRGVLVGLGALLGIVLLAQGFVVIGGILLVMAVLRVVMLVKMRRRRAVMMQRRQAFAARGGRWTTQQPS